MNTVETKYTSTQQETINKFITYVIDQCYNDKGFSARLRRADNPATEYYAWDLLASWGVDLENPRQRLPYIMIIAAIARAKITQNGSITLGRGLTMAYEDGKESKPAQARLRRLLACSDIEELTAILRSVLALIQSKLNGSLDYSHLLNQLLWFPRSPQRVKAQWAKEFFQQASQKADKES